MRRREFLLASLALLAPALSRANEGIPRALDWPEFVAAMRELAAREYRDRNAVQALGESGLRLLRRLDVGDGAFRQAVEMSWESGNRFWLWQRLSREPRLNGGILTIERDHDVPLHDHPHATGMLRILGGEAEIWQFDRLAVAHGQGDPAGQAELECVSHRVLRPGDTAVLYPHAGNIHALRALTPSCRMLDYFVPPYVRSQRNWFEPVNRDWRERQRIRCRVVPEQAFHTA